MVHAKTVTLAALGNPNLGLVFIASDSMIMHMQI